MSLHRGLTARRLAALTACIALGAAAGLSAQESRLGFRTGVEQTSGDYGGSRSFRDRYVPVTLLYERRRLSFRATVPWLEMEFLDRDSQSIVTESGIGDVVLGLTLYDVFTSSDASLSLDIAGKLKLGTADESKGLGTGENDYSVQADVYKFLGRNTLVLTAAYLVRGETEAFPLDDSWQLSAGGFHRFPNSTSAGLFLDVRESALAGYESIRELTASLARPLAGEWRIQGYLVRGLSDTSLDWSVGISTRRDL